MNEPRRRSNTAVFLLAAAAIAVIALVPAVCGQLARPSEHYPTRAEAARRAAVPLPALVPPSATEIYDRRDAAAGARWLRFTFAERDVPAMTTGLRRLTVEQAGEVEVPNPGWSDWWLLSSRTLSGGQGKQLQVWEAGDAYLVLDPRTRTAYWWTRAPSPAAAQAGG